MSDCSDSRTALINKLQLENGGPVAFQDVKADAAQLINVGVIDLCVEKHFGRAHRIVFGQKNLSLELSAFVRGIGRPADFDIEVSAVVGIRVYVDALDLVLFEHHQLLIRKPAGCVATARSCFIFWTGDLEVRDLLYVLKN